VGASSYELTEPGLDWRRYWSALERYRWWVLLVSALGLAVGIAISRLLKPDYLAQATIWIEVGNERRGGGGVDQGPIRSSQLLDARAWQDLLKSYVVLDSVVRERQLYLHLAEPADSTAFTSFSLAERFRPGKYRLEVAIRGAPSHSWHAVASSCRGVRREILSVAVSASLAPAGQRPQAGSYESRSRS